MSAEWEDCDDRNRSVPTAGTPIPEADAPGGSPAGRATRRPLSCYSHSYATESILVWAEVLRGGLWSSIDKIGKEVVPVERSRDGLLKRVDRP